MNYVIEMKNVKKSFKEVNALNDINFDVKRGEIFGLLGPSGAGKTTIIKILTGQLGINRGESRLFGCKSEELSSNEFRQIGTVLDESGIYKRLTVYDNMKLFADLYGVSKKEILEVLERVGLGQSLKIPAEKLSKGMMQRLVLARALLNKPMVLFLDEPTSGLDPSTVLIIHELIKEQRDRGCTVFLTTHNMEEASKLCDRVVLLNNGLIVENDEPKSLCRKYNRDNRINIRLKTGELKSFRNERDEIGELFEYFKTESIETIHSSEPNLEDVFIELTGRKLA